MDPRYHNHCVQCLASYIQAGLTNTYVIPVQPVPATRIAPRVGHAGVGVAFRGVRLDAPAPLDAFLEAHTLAPFDDCGGHVNPVVGYHIHAVTDCLEEGASKAGHAAEIGIALDGYPLHARLDADGTAPQDLDACGGHTTAGATPARFRPVGRPGGRRAERLTEAAGPVLGSWSAPVASAGRATPSGRRTDERSGDAMSSSHVEIARRYFEGVYSGDASVVEELATPDVVMSYPVFQGVFGTPTLEGRPAVKAFVERFAQKWADPRLAVHESISDGRWVVLVWGFSARNVGALRPGTEPTEHRWGGVSCFRFAADGRICAEFGEESVPGPAARLEAAGSRP